MQLIEIQLPSIYLITSITVKAAAYPASKSCGQGQVILCYVSPY